MSQNTCPTVLNFFFENETSLKKKEQYLTTEVENLLKEIQEGLITKRDFDNKCDRSYEICYNYIYNWVKLNYHNYELKDLLWVTFTPKIIVNWNNLKRFLIETCNTICIDGNNFFDQFKIFEKYFKKQSEE